MVKLFKSAQAPAGQATAAALLRPAEVENAEVHQLKSFEECQQVAQANKESMLPTNKKAHCDDNITALIQVSALLKEGKESEARILFDTLDGVYEFGNFKVYFETNEDGDLLFKSQSAGAETGWLIIPMAADFHLYLVKIFHELGGWCRGLAQIHERLEKIIVYPKPWLEDFFERDPTFVFDAAGTAGNSVAAFSGHQSSIRVPFAGNGMPQFAQFSNTNGGALAVAQMQHQQGQMQMQMQYQQGQMQMQYQQGQMQQQQMQQQQMMMSSTAQMQSVSFAAAASEESSTANQRAADSSAELVSLLKQQLGRSERQNDDLTRERDHNFQGLRGQLQSVQDAVTPGGRGRRRAVAYESPGAESQVQVDRRGPLFAAAAYGSPLADHQPQAAAEAPTANCHPKGTVEAHNSPLVDRQPQEAVEAPAVNRQAQASVEAHTAEPQAPPLAASPVPAAEAPAAERQASPLAIGSPAPVDANLATESELLTAPLRPLFVDGARLDFASSRPVAMNPAKIDPRLLSLLMGPSHEAVLSGEPSVSFITADEAASAWYNRSPSPKRKRKTRDGDEGSLGQCNVRSAPEWQCPASACSTSNASDESACLKCGTRRPILGEKLKWGSIMDKYKCEGQWQCHACLASNDKENGECKACTVPKGAITTAVASRGNGTSKPAPVAASVFTFGSTKVDATDATASVGDDALSAAKVKTNTGSSSTNEPTVVAASVFIFGSGKADATGATASFGDDALGAAKVKPNTGSSSTNEPTVVAASVFTFGNAKVDATGATASFGDDDLSAATANDSVAISSTGTTVAANAGGNNSQATAAMTLATASSSGNDRISSAIGEGEDARTSVVGLTRDGIVETAPGTTMIWKFIVVEESLGGRRVWRQLPRQKSKMTWCALCEKRNGSPCHMSAKHRPNLPFLSWVVEDSNA